MVMRSTAAQRMFAPTPPVGTGDPSEVTTPPPSTENAEIVFPATVRLLTYTKPLCACNAGTKHSMASNKVMEKEERERRRKDARHFTTLTRFTTASAYTQLW